MSDDQTTAEQFAQRLETAKEVNQTLAQCLKDGLAADNELVQQTIAKHYEWMKEITIHGGPTIYRLLAKHMRNDERYSRIYDEYYAEGLTEFMAAAIDIFSETLTEDDSSGVHTSDHQNI